MQSARFYYFPFIGEHKPEAFNDIFRAMASEGCSSFPPVLCYFRVEAIGRAEMCVCQALGLEAQTQTDLGPAVSSFETRKCHLLHVLVAKIIQDRPCSRSLGTVPGMF